MTNRTPRPRSRALLGTWRFEPWLLVAVSVVVLGIHAKRYWPFLSDDALISLRYSERLVAGMGLTWTDGERVEGYTDLLWVLLVAAFHALGLDAIHVARAIDFLGVAAGVVLASTAGRPWRLETARALTGGLALALAAPAAVWAIAGLEHGAMVGVIVAAIVAIGRAIGPTRPHRRSLLVAGAPLGALVLFRADGVVLVGMAGLGALAAMTPWRRGRLGTATRATAWLALIPVAAVLGQLAFRWLYYGELVPNTAVAKVSFNLHRVELGWRHLRAGFAPLLPMLGLVAVGVAAGWRRIPRGRFAVPFAIALGWNVYLMAVGGDIFPGWRQLLLGIAPLAVLLGEAGAALARRGRAALAAAIAIPVLAYGVKLQSRDSENRRAIQERWEWDGEAIGHLLRTTVGDRAPLLAVDAAGALSYWSKLPSLDMLGLLDRWIAHNPPPGFGRGPIGHELGNGDYVWRRAPDLIAFNNAGGARHPAFRSGRELIARRDFAQRYRLVPVQGVVGNRAMADLYVRTDGKLGFVTSQERLAIPGWFFANDGSRATLGARGGLVVPIGDQRLGELRDLRPPPGAYRLTALPADSGLTVVARCNGISMTEIQGGDPALLEVAPGARLDRLVSTPTGAPAELLEVGLEVVAGAPPGLRCPRGGAPLVRSLERVATPRGEGSRWDAPAHVVMSGAGLRIVLPRREQVTGVTFSADANDRYELSFLAGDAALATVAAGPTPGRHDLVVHRLEVPVMAFAAGFDSILLRPSGGDGRYSLGHLALEP